MLKRHSQFLQSILFLFDLTLISVCWMAAYYVRFVGGWGPIERGVPPLEIYIYLIVPILFVWGVSFKSFNLYRPRRMGSHLAEVLDIAVANSLSVLILVGLTFFVRQFEYSRLVFVYFWVLNLVALSSSRMVFREGLRFFRKQGFNQRHCVIIGADKLGQRIAHSLSLHPEFGLTVHGYLTHQPKKLGQTFEGVTVIGLFGDLEKYAPALDIVFLCLPPEAEPQAEKMLGYLATTTVEVKVVPSIYEFITLRAEAEMFEGVPVITLQGSPLYGWSTILKRSSDVIGSVIALSLTLPVQGIIALLIKLTSPGPVFFKQERMGLDGKPFMMLKFRTMHVDHQGDTVLLTPMDDARVTPIGKVLRRMSLDELPQFWNVLKGDMSVVGPRPERSWVVEEVRKQIPLYMLKHKMKAGITGWAQVSGWRGDTSLEKRVEFDLYYIEHWSIWLDLKIMWLTIWQGFIHKHAY